MRAAALALLLALPARAEPVEITTGPDGSTVTLRDDRGPCSGPARLAVWESADRSERVLGCWVARGALVLVSYLDGDRGVISRASFASVKGT